MKKTLVWVLSVFCFGLFGLSSAYAQERGNKDDATRMVEAAVAHVKKVGAEQAFQDFSTPGGAWHNKDVYLFCYKNDGTNVCHGANKALIGKNLIEMKTADGQLLIKNFVDLVKSKGKGWVDYKWPHPQTKKLEDKEALVIGIPGYDGLLGAGIYK